MEPTGKNRVCSAEHAGALDIRIRKLLQNPQKILNPYIHEGMTAADLGCGPGFFTIEMAKMVGKTGKVTAIDLQEEMLQIVRKKVSGTDLQNTVKFHNCPADKIGLTETFDFILVFWMLHEVPDQSAFLQEIFLLLNPKGRVLICEPKFHVTAKDFSFSETTMMKCGFKIVEEPKIFFSRSVLLSKNDEV
jgi:ubiquinone/menaquinone biosynthesis C-methylase UbiE